MDEDASETIKDEEGDRLKSQLSGGITYDTRDSVFLTRKDDKVDLQAYVAGGFLGGDTDIYGFDLEASKYFLLPWDTILTLNGEIASVATWAGGDRVPIFDRLYLGGANNLRGFNFRDVGPKDEDGEPIGGNTLARFTVEYTFPIVEKMRGAVFYDVGFVNAGATTSAGNVNSDVGIGVRLDLPIGPVRIDYGIPDQDRSVQRLEREVQLQHRLSILNGAGLASGLRALSFSPSIHLHEKPTSRSLLLLAASLLRRQLPLPPRPSRSAPWT